MWPVRLLQTTPFHAQQLELVVVHEERVWLVIFKDCFMVRRYCFSILWQKLVLPPWIDMKELELEKKVMMRKKKALCLEVIII